MTKGPGGRGKWTVPPSAMAGLLQIFFRVEGAVFQGLFPPLAAGRHGKVRQFRRIVTKM